MFNLNSGDIKGTYFFENFSNIGLINDEKFRLNIGEIKDDICIKRTKIIVVITIDFLLALILKIEYDLGNPVTCLLKDG